VRLFCGVYRKSVGGANRGWYDLEMKFESIVSSPSFDGDRDRAKKFAENARYLEEHAEEIKEQKRLEDERRKSSLLQHGIDVDRLENEITKEDISKLIEVGNDTVDRNIGAYARVLLEKVAQKRPREFSDAFTALLDFDNPRNFGRTADLLDEYQYIQAGVLHEEEEHSGFWGPDVLQATNPEVYERITQSSRTMRSCLEDAVNRQKGNYILNIYSRSLLEQMEPPKAQTLDEMTSPYTEDGWSLSQSQIKQEEVDDDEPGRNITAEEILLPSERHALVPEVVDQYLADYRFYTSRWVQPKLTSDFGTSFSELIPRERFYFLKFLRENDMHAVARLQSFSKQHGADGLRTFLVTAGDPLLREQVFEFAQSVPEADARNVFTAYGKLVGSIDSVGDYLREQFGHNEDSATDAVVEQLLKRARKVLENATSHGNDPDMLRKINAVNDDNAIFLESYKALKGKEGISFQQAKDLRFESGPGSALSEEDAGVVEKIIRDALADETESYREAVVKGFRKALNDASSEFFVLRYQDHPVGIIRYDDHSEGSNREYYIGTFYVDQKFSGARLGEEMFERSIDHKRQEGVTFSLHCRPDAAITRRYLDMGFVADGAQSASTKLGYVWHMRRTTESESLPTKQLPALVVFDRANETGRVYDKPPAEFPKGKVLSRLGFKDERYYPVFEDSLAA